MQEPETHDTRGKMGHVAYEVVGDGPFDLVFVTCNTCDGRWGENPVPLAALPTRTTG